MPSDTRTESPGTALRLPSSAKMLRLCACCAPSSIQLFFLNSCVLLLISRSHPFFETLAPPKLVHDIHDARFADGRPLWSGQRESSHLTLTFPFIAFFGGMGAKVAVPPHLAHHAASRSDSLPDSGSAAAGRGKGGGRLMWIEVIGKFLHGVYARVFDADILAIKDFNVKPH